MTEIGHNSGLTVAKAQLLAFIERVERMESEIKDRQKDRADIYAEAKNVGYDIAALKIIVRERKIDPAKRHERGAVLDVYRDALGMIA